MRRLFAAGIGGLALLTACTGGGSTPPTGSPTPSTAVTSPTALGDGGGETSPPSSTAPSTSAPSTKATSAGAAKELPGPCPYLSAEDAREAEGDRVGNVFRLSGDPVGCRFYFEYDETAIVLQITFQKYVSNTTALNAIIALTKTHPEYVPDHNIGDGAISIKADLQGNQTWQCSFVKGDYVVTVHTRQPDPSFNARKIAHMIASKVP